jgi:hypothetical protein
MLIVLVLLALGGVAYDRMQMMRWVGVTHLTLVFVVTDTETGQPIEDAEVLIHPGDEGSRYLEGKELPLALKTDGQGVARYELADCKCGGEFSNLGFTDTRGVHFPAWLVAANAPGYLAADPICLYDIPGRKKVEHTGPGKDKLVVPISLSKSQP